MKRYRRGGAGAKKQLEHLEDELRRKMKEEEDVYGHSLDEDDILWLWRELMAERAMDIWKEQGRLEKDGEKLEPKKV